MNVFLHSDGTIAQGFLLPKSLLKQIRMRTGAGKKDGGIGDIIDQQPIRRDMAFPKSKPFSGELVWTSVYGERARSFVAS